MCGFHLICMVYLMFQVLLLIEAYEKCSSLEDATFMLLAEFVILLLFACLMAWCSKSQVGYSGYQKSVLVIEITWNTYVIISSSIRIVWVTDQLFWVFIYFFTIFFFQISCEQALAAFEARLEMDELAVYQRETETIIYKPLVEYTWVWERKACQRYCYA